MRTFVRYAENALSAEQHRYIWSEIGATIFARWFVTRHPGGVVLVYSGQTKVIVFHGNGLKDGYPIQVHPRSEVLLRRFPQ